MTFVSLRKAVGVVQTLKQYNWDADGA